MHIQANVWNNIPNRILYIDSVERSEAIISELFENSERGGGDPPTKTLEQEQVSL